MWEQVEIDLPPDIAAVTTSVWHYPGRILVGVMRHSFLAPPVLWAQVLKSGFRELRKAPAFLTELQQLIVAPTVYAEAETSQPRNQDFLRFLGFEKLDETPERKLYRRSI